jgi:superfamily I DNA/RNA helicase
VVDEAQDLHPPAWRMLRAAVAEGPDDLFVVGDPHQRIYDAKVSLAQVGIKVTGRSTRLRVNYRTTDEILTWATGIMTGVPVDDLGEEGVPDTLADCRSPLHGPAPTLCRAPDRDKEMHALVDQARAWLEAGVRAADIAVVARTWQLADLVTGELRAAGIEAVQSRGTPPAPQTPGVRVGTMHAMKGLEFRCVAVAGVDADLLPRASALTDPAVDPLQYEADLLAERCLLFVACTRARDALYVSWTGRPSPFLPL